MDLRNTHMVDGVLRAPDIPQDRLFELDTLFREIFLDSKIPITKVIGFYIEDENDSRNSAISRVASCCLDNPVAISNALSKVSFAHTGTLLVLTNSLIGEVTSKDLTIYTGGDALKALSTKPVKIATFTNKAKFRFILNTATGQKSIDENVEIIKSYLHDIKKYDSNLYYPLNTHHTVSDDLFVLPFNGKEVRYRVKDKNLETELAELWDRYKEDFSSGN